MNALNILTAIVANILFVSVHSANERTTSFRLAAKNELPSVAPLAVINSTGSALECARRCKGDFRLTCCSYGYHAAGGHCRLYTSVCSDGVPTLPGLGFDYFEEFQEEVTGAIGDACAVNGDCTVENAECRDGICQCVIGYHFNPGPGTCVAICPSGYGTGFYEVKGECLNGNNDVVDYDLDTLPECWALCQTDPQCRSFEVGYSKCHLSYTTKLEHPSDWKSCGKANYYQRDCA